MYKLELDSERVENASIMVRWCLSPKLVEKLQATNIRHYIVISVLDSKGREFRDKFLLSQGVGFITLESAGEINIKSWISDIDGINNLMNKKSAFSFYFSRQDIEKNEKTEWKLYDYYEAEEDIGDIEVPEELFAEPLSEFQLNIMGLWQNNYYIDECARRRRKMFTYCIKSWAILGLTFAKIFTNICLLIYATVSMFNIKALNWKNFGFKDYLSRQLPRLELFLLDYVRFDDLYKSFWYQKVIPLYLQVTSLWTFDEWDLESRYRNPLKIAYQYFNPFMGMAAVALLGIFGSLTSLIWIEPGTVVGFAGVIHNGIMLYIFLPTCALLGWGTGKRSFDLYDTVVNKIKESPDNKFFVLMRKIKSFISPIFTTGAVTGIVAILAAPFAAIALTGKFIHSTLKDTAIGKLCHRFVNFILGTKSEDCYFCGPYDIKNLLDIMDATKRTIKELLLLEQPLKVDPLN